MTTITYTKDQVHDVFSKLAAISSDAQLIERNTDYRLDGRAACIRKEAEAIADIMRAGKASDGTPPLLDKVAA